MPRGRGAGDRAPARGCAPAARVPDDEALAGGFFMAPTVLDRVAPGAEVADEEVFGPVLAAMTWRDEAEAVALANAGRYGLTAAIWTQDIDRAFRMADRIEAGYLWINDVETRFPAVPFGGWGDSGVGPGARPRGAAHLHADEGGQPSGAVGRGVRARAGSGPRTGSPSAGWRVRPAVGGRDRHRRLVLRQPAPGRAQREDAGRARASPTRMPPWLPATTATAPTTSAVNGRLPRCAIWWKAMTRPRRSSGISSWRVAVRTGKHSENPNPMRPTRCRRPGASGAKAVTTTPAAWNRKPARAPPAGTSRAGGS